MPEQRPSDHADAELLALLERALGHDQVAWFDFVQQVNRLLRKAARRWLIARGWSGRGLDLDDLVQEIWKGLVARDCARLRRYDPKKSRLSTYLWHQAGERLRDYFGSRKNRPVAAQPLPDASEVPDPQAAPEWVELVCTEVAAELDADGRQLLAHCLHAAVGADGPQSWPAHKRCRVAARVRRSVQDWCGGV